MQLLNLSFNIVELEEIVNNVHIDSNFTITHPRYQPLELEQRVVDMLKQLPSDIQNKYLNLQLRTFLHGIYCDGSLVPALDEHYIDNHTSENQLENNTVRGINRNYYKDLDSSNSGKGFYEPGWQVLGSDDGLLVVQKNVTLHVEFNSLGGAERSDTVSVLMPKNRLQHGYYVAIGNAGFVNMCSDTPTIPTVDIYFHFTQEGAVNTMASLTSALNAINIPFTYKVIYDNNECKHHNDGGILNIEQKQYPVVLPILRQIYTEQASHFLPNIPLFTKYLAPGLGIAETPPQHNSNETFCMNRCRILAWALLTAYQNGDNTPSARFSSIKQHFAQNKISLEHPYLNSNSKDIYQF